MAPRKSNRKLSIAKDSADLLTIALESHSFPLDEIIAYQFHGRPPLPPAAMTVTYLTTTFGTVSAADDMRNLLLSSCDEHEIG